MHLLNLTTTDELITAYGELDVYDRPALEVAIPAAIDAVYAARDADLTMHGAGAAAAVAVIDALEELGVFEP